MAYRIVRRLPNGTKSYGQTRFETKADALIRMLQYSAEFITPKGFRAISWCFDDGTVRTGYTDGTMWNGFINVWVLPEVRDEIVADLRMGGEDDEETANMLFHEPTDTNGLVSLAYGYATTEIEVS